MEEKKTNYKKRMKDIFLNFMEIMIRCAKDPEFKADFEKRPGKYLNEVGMNIPDHPNVQIILDQSERRWPAIYLFPKNKANNQGDPGTESVEFYEGALSLIIDKASDNKQENTEVMSTNKKGKELRIKTGWDLDNCDVKILIPYLVPNTDVLVEYEFSDNYDEDEIILTTA
jgi:hypothetical protein